MIALVHVPTLTVLGIFGAGPININVPQLQVFNADVGYVSTNGAYKILAVTPFVVPQGQQTVGPPTHSTDGNTVTETYVVQAIPAPPIPTVVSNSTLIGRLTGVEQVAIYKAANTAMVNGNASYMLWLTASNARGTIDLADPATIAVKAAIVTAGLLSQARADAVFAV